MIDLKASVVGQKETVFRIRENGTARVVLERNSVVELAVALLWRVIGDAIAERTTTVGASGVNTFLLLQVLFDIYFFDYHVVM